MTWLVAVSEYMRQSQAIAALGELDFLTYCPQYRERVIRRGRRVSELRSYFGRYFFVLMCDRWKAVYHTKGVSTLLLGPELEPYLVPDATIKEIKDREVGGLIQIDRSKGNFLRGQTVTPKSGYLVGLEGKFDKIIQRDREVALFNILGVETPVEFASGVLIASNARQALSVPRQGKRRRRRFNFKNTAEESVPHHAQGAGG